MKHYLAYLLRLWQASDQEESAWRASLEDPHTHLVRSFDSLQALYDYLQALECSSDGSEKEDTRQ